MTLQRATSLLFQAIYASQGIEPPEIDLKKLLPYPDWRPPGAQPLGPTEETLKVIRRLFAQRRIPMAAFLAMQTPTTDRS